MIYKLNKNKDKKTYNSRLISRECLPYQNKQHNRISSIIKDINELDPLSNLTITNKKTT